MNTPQGRANSWPTKRGSVGVFDFGGFNFETAIPGRVHRCADDDDAAPVVVKKKVVYATELDRLEARRKTWREYYARNREARIEAVMEWKRARKLRGESPLDGGTGAST